MRVSRQSIDTRITKLRALGVTEAAFFPDGRLASVKLGAIEDSKAEDSGQPLAKKSPEIYRLIRNAVGVLEGVREDIGDDS